MEEKLRAFGRLAKKGLKFSLTKAPAYARKFLNSNVGNVAKDLVRKKIGSKTYNYLAKGVNIVDNILGNESVQNLSNRVL